MPNTVAGFSGTPAHIAVGGGHACAVISEDDSVQCWGFGTAGQLGDGATTTTTIPVSVSSAEDFASVHAAGSHSCAVTLDGRSYCWGRQHQRPDRQRHERRRRHHPRAAHRQLPRRRDLRRELARVHPADRRQRLLLGQQPQRLPRRRNPGRAHPPGPRPRHERGRRDHPGSAARLRPSDLGRRGVLGATTTSASSGTETADGMVNRFEVVAGAAEWIDVDAGADSTCVLDASGGPLLLGRQLHRRRTGRPGRGG